MKEQDLKTAVENITISENAKMRILKRTKNHRKEENSMKSRKRFVPITIAATLALGITAFATVTHYSRGFSQKMNINEEQMERLQNSDSSLVAMPNVSDSHDGITVSSAQCLFDGNSVRMSFYVEGYELEKTEEPELEYLNILLDGKIGHNYDWSFFDGIDWTDRKHPVMADGSPVQEDENGSYIRNYRIADGKMEIDLNWSPFVDGDGRLSGEDLNGKTITVIMQNFGDKKGKWTLDWTLDNLEQGKTFTLDFALGDTGAKVNEVTLYSASCVVKYDFQKKDIETDAYDENGKLYKTTDFAEPPTLVGVKLKDGTVLMDINDGGSNGYENGDLNEFVSRVNFSRIIDADEIDSLLFAKNQLKAKMTENDCYTLKLK